jgi:hypothetical protein
MMGERQTDQAALFYEFSLEAAVAAFVLFVLLHQEPIFSPRAERPDGVAASAWPTVAVLPASRAGRLRSAQRHASHGLRTGGQGAQASRT